MEAEEELAAKINQLQIQKAELQEALEDALQTIKTDRQLWAQEHSVLSQQIQDLKQDINRLEAQAELNQRIIDEEKQHRTLLYEEFSNLQTSYNNIRDQLAKVRACQKIKNRSCKEEACSQQEPFIQTGQQKQSQYDKTQGRKRFHSQFWYAQTDPICPPSSQLGVGGVNIFQPLEEADLSLEQNSGVHIPHSLRGSLQALNFTQNFSIHSSQRRNEDARSQFTLRVLQCTQDCSQNIPPRMSTQLIQELPQQECLLTDRGQENIEKDWWERASLFASGCCLGAYLFWHIPF